MTTVAELEKEVDALEKRLVALGERVVALEGINVLMPRDLTPVVDGLADTRLQTIGLGERVELLEARSATPAPNATGDDYLSAIDKMHVQLFGVPVGTVQSLKDAPIAE